MANLASLFAMPLALVAENVKEYQKSRLVPAQKEANQKESNTVIGGTKAADVEMPHSTGEIKLNNAQREVAGNKTSPKKKKKKKQNKWKQEQVHIPGYIDYDKKAAEEAHLLDSSQWMRNDASASAAKSHESEPAASASQQPLVSYEELLHPRIFRKTEQWRGGPDTGKERPNNKSASTSVNGLQSALPLNEAPSSRDIEGATRTETVLSSVESSESLSTVCAKRVHAYVDYDKKLVEDAEMHDPFVRGWTDMAASAAGNHDNGAKALSSSLQREIISYEELSRPKNYSNRSRGGRGRGQNYNRGQHHTNNGVIRGTFKGPPPEYSGPPNKIQRLMGGELMARSGVPATMPMMPCSFIDPNVAATEKEEIFERQQPVVVVKPNVRKPLNNKQKKKIEKAKFYQEKIQQQLEREKEKEKAWMAAQKQLPCRFFSNGNCTKGDDCPYSHDFVPPKKPELCKFYVMSVCEKGAHCFYYHNDWPCKFFHVFRSCVQGDACRFSHLPLTEETRTLLEKSLNDGIPNCNPPVAPAELNQPTNGSNLPPAVTTINETPRVFGDNAALPISFYGADNFPHTQQQQQQTSTEQQTPTAANDPDFDPSIEQEPWDEKLEPIDLDETHHPRLPSGVHSGDSTFFQDPRMERYRAFGKSMERSVAYCNALDVVITPSVGMQFERDGHSTSTFLTSSSSSSDLKSVHASSVCDNTASSSWGGTFSTVRRSSFVDLASTDSATDSKEPFQSSCSLFSSKSGSENAGSDDVKMKSARHFSLPLTRHAVRGVGEGRLVRNRAAGVVVTTASNGQATNGQASNGQATNGQASNGQASNGQASNGQAPPGVQQSPSVN